MFCQTPDFFCSLMTLYCLSFHKHNPYKVVIPTVINYLVLNSDKDLKGNKKVLINTIIP